MTMLHGPARRTAAVLAALALVMEPSLPVIAAARSHGPVVVGMAGQWLAHEPSAQTTSKPKAVKS